MLPVAVYSLITAGKQWCNDSKWAETGLADHAYLRRILRGGGSRRIQLILKDLAESEKVVQVGRFPQILVSSHRSRSIFIRLIIRGSQDDDGDVAALLAGADVPQNFGTGLFGQIEIDNHEAKVATAVFFDVTNEIDCSLPIVNDDQLTAN